MLGFGLLAAHDDSEFRALVRAGAPCLLLEEHARPNSARLPFVAEHSRAPALRIMWTDDKDKAPEGGWHPEMKAKGWIAYALAETAMHRAAQIARERGLYLRVIGPNEPHLPTLEAYYKYGYFEGERAMLLHDIGARAVIGNFAVGTTTPENLTAFFSGVLAYLSEHDRLDVEFNIGLHEYGYIWPWAWLDTFQGNDINPQPGKIPAIPPPGALGWLIGRFQLIYQLATLDELAPLRLLERTIDMTEVGLDLVESDRWQLPKDHRGESFGGYKTCKGYWWDYFPTINWEDLYREFLHWVAAYYSQFIEDEEEEGKKEGGIGKLFVFGKGVHHTKPEWPNGQFFDYDIGATRATLAMTEDNPWLPISAEPEPPVRELSRTQKVQVAVALRLAERHDKIAQRYRNYASKISKGL
jgi:hypothetical protein